MQQHMAEQQLASDLAKVAKDRAISHEATALSLVVRAVVAAVLREKPSHPDVDDATHETLRRAFEGRSRLREGEPFRPWVVGIARHVALDVLRQRRRALREEPVDGPDSDAGTRTLASLVDPAPTPDDHAALRQRAERVDKALATLSDEQQAAMRMFHVEGIGYQVIAARLRVPLGTVATWLSRGRRAVADALGETEGVR
jgi:RNA polymerase sigma factor (sigma-70 family)